MGRGVGKDTPLGYVHSIRQEDPPKSSMGALAVAFRGMKRILITKTHCGAERMRVLVVAAGSCRDALGWWQAGPFAPVFPDLLILVVGTCVRGGVCWRRSTWRNLPALPLLQLIKVYR